MRAVLVLVLAACASGQAGRFRDQPIVWQVDDKRSIPEPSDNDFSTYKLGYYINGYLFTPIEYAVDPPRRGPARDTNALDEVPNSTWFENRIGVRDISPDEIVKGPNLRGPPALPLEITNAKTEGGNPGFFVKDATGARYLIKFDTAQNPEQQTATDVIVGRIFWALGYHVPSDHVIYFRRTDLRIAPKLAGKVTDRDIDRLMREATRRGDEYRAIASAFLPGKPRGGWPVLGVREGDVNDTIPHEDRRELRALRVFCAWLGHTDIKPDNTLDMYVEEDGKRYLKHHMIDFGEALGGHQSEKDVKEVGFEFAWDWGANALGLVTLGLWVRHWEGQQKTPWPSVGYFGAAYFEPEGWRERYPYEVFRFMDAADAYWAAKIVMRFTRPQLEALVAEAKLSEPAAGTYLVDTLLARRDKIGRAYLDGVTPFDRFAIEDGKLCGTDLSRAYQIATAGTLIVQDGDKPAASYPLPAEGRTCIPLATDGGYHVLRVRIRRPTHTTPASEIHYRASSPPRLLGVVR